MGLQSLVRQLCPLWPAPWQMVPCLMPPQLFPAQSAPAITAAALHSACVCACVLKRLVHMESMCALVPGLKREGFWLTTRGKGVPKASIIFLLITPELCGKAPRTPTASKENRQRGHSPEGLRKKEKEKENFVMVASVVHWMNVTFHLRELLKLYVSNFILHLWHHFFCRKWSCLL